MRNLSASFPACRASLRTLSCALLFFAAVQAAHAQRAENAQAAGGFSPGARASASANATLDSVVGNRPSPVKKEVSLGGAVYRVTPQATVIGPDGKAISGGCPAPDTLAEGQFVAGGAPAEPALRGNGGAGTNSGKSETVMIGVTDQRLASVAGNGAHVPLKPAATMNASFGPAGVYVLPVPCRQSGSDRQAMINDAAASLASAGGNAFALAGNRDGMKEATQATTLADGDIMLSVAQPENAAPRLVQIDTAHQGAVR